MDNYIVQTNHLKKYYQMGKNTIRALDGVDFCVKEHEFVAIIGRAAPAKVHCCICSGDLIYRRRERCMWRGRVFRG